MDYASKSQEEALDNDFRRILYIIKHYIQYVNSNHYLTLYRSWLEKLSTANGEKVERNMYLFELARQIKSNRLLPPFNHHPPIGSLRSLPKINFFRPSEIENLIHLETANNKDPPNFQYAEPTFPQEFIDKNYSNTQQQFLSQNQLSSSMKNPSKYPDSYMQTIFMQPSNRYYHPCYAEASDTGEQVKTPTKTKKRKSKGARNLQKASAANVPKEKANFINDKQEKEVAQTTVTLSTCSPSDLQEITAQSESLPEEEPSIKDDSSWCDLSESSRTSINLMACGDNKKSPPRVQDKVKQFNGISKTLEEPQGPDQNKKPSEGLYEKSTSRLPDDNEKSGQKIQNLTEAKVTLKDTNFISLDWKKTIEALQLRLTETLNQNNELKSIINALQVKLKEEATKNKEQNEAKQKKCELRKREIEAIQQIQADNMKKLEKCFQKKIGEAERSYQQKVEKMKANYETKIRELLKKHDYTKKEKDQEMCRLSEIIQQQCIRMSNEIAALRVQIENAFSNHSCEDKIIVLQKCVSKMDKLFHRSEKEYLKQIDKLKQELDLKDKVMQIQLKTQRAELIARTSIEKQKQFDDVINNLEIKYIKMLEYHESQVMELKIQDEEKIEQLKHLLDKNNIPYDNFL